MLNLLILALVGVAAAEEGTTSRCTAESVCATADQIPVCSAFKRPELDPTTCCLSCKRPEIQPIDTTCTEEVIKACAAPTEYCTLEQFESSTTSLPPLVECCRSCKFGCSLTEDQRKALPVCEGEVTYSRSAETGICPSCKKAEAVQCTKYEELDDCAAGVLPTRDDNNCVSCKPTTVCTSELKRACVEPPTCVEGERPALDAACCPTCKPPVIAACDEAAVARCRANYENLRECDAATEGAWSKELCCFTCRTPLGERVTDPERNCDLDEFKQCLPSLAPCAADEEPLRAPDSCCPSCARPERLCKLEDAARCLATAEVCAADERPTPIDGSCCVSCKPARPACDPACGDKEVCVRSAAGPTCRARRRIIAKVTRTLNRLADEDLSDEEVTERVALIVSRYCERAENEARCEAVKERIEALVAKRLDNGDLAIDLPEPEVMRKRADDDAQNVVEEAMVDEDANDGAVASATFSVEEPEGAEPSAAARLASPLSLLF